MTFLTILDVTEILCSFRLVLEGKTVKEICFLITIKLVNRMQAFFVSLFFHTNVSQVKHNISFLFNMKSH